VADYLGVRREVFDIYKCRECGSYAFGGTEEIVHLSNNCVRHPERVVIERLVAVPILREYLTASTEVGL
jgi:hypothetical protein